MPADNNDTIYWSGQSFPRMGRNTDVIGGSVYPNAFYRLGIPAPTTAPTVAVGGGSSLNVTITTTNESATLTLTTASVHDAVVDDYVTIANVTGTIGGIAAANINGTFRIRTVPSTTTVTILVSEAATSSVTSSSITNGASFGENSEAELDYETSYVYTLYLHMEKKDRLHQHLQS